MHNLKPSDTAENSRRGNLPFGYMTGSGVYEPHDDVKGDVARILFYMATMYLDLNIESGILGDLDVLLEWHQNDPVDDFERNRNEVIYSHQGNRNPFIDYPFLAEEIW
jgi:endonuclease I